MATQARRLNVAVSAEPPHLGTCTKIKRFFLWSVPQRRAPLPGSRRKHSATLRARSSAFDASLASSSLSSLSVWYQLREAISVHWLTRPSPMTGAGRRRSCSEDVGRGGLRWRPLNQYGTPTASRQNATRTPILRGDGPRGSARGFLARRIDARRLLWRSPGDLCASASGGCRGACSGHQAICAGAEAQSGDESKRVAGVQIAVSAKCRKISRSGRPLCRMAVGITRSQSACCNVAK